MRLTVSLSFLLAALFPGLAGAQTVRGVVVEDGSTTPIAAATIELLGLDSTVLKTVESDARGWFHIEPSAPGQYLLRATHLSYTARGSDTVSVGKHEIVTVVLRMGRAAIPLDPLVVTARTRDRLGDFYDRAEQNKFGYFVKRDYIESRVARPPSTLLQMTPGVRVERGEDFLSNVITISGPGGRCAPAVFLDGLPIPAGIATIDDLSASDLIEGIEVYSAHSRIPEMYQLEPESLRCGVVGYWTVRKAYRQVRWSHAVIGVVLAGTFFLLTRM